MRLLSGRRTLVDLDSMILVSIVPEGDLTTVVVAALKRSNVQEENERLAREALEVADRAAEALPGTEVARRLERLSERVEILTL